MRSDDRLDSLLARGRLSGPTRERMLEVALARSGTRATRSIPFLRRPLLWLVPACAVAAAMVLFARHNQFTAKGPGSVPPALGIACSAGSLGRCPSGAKLLFTIDVAPQGGFLAAYAQPRGTGERIWYFPTANGALPQVAARAGLQTIRQAVRIGPEQPAGRYTIHLVLARRPVSRGEVIEAKGPAILASHEVELEVIP